MLTVHSVGSLNFGCILQRSCQIRHTEIRTSLKFVSFFLKTILKLTVVTMTVFPSQVALYAISIYAL